MGDLIRLLPDALANQIAAGEVVQRPASAVKELLENAIDAGASRIQLIVKDAGKTLIQVVDNGSGMSERDAVLCFERHATSKIKDTDDLFNIRTKGFRGEALASIAAVAQVELKTKRETDKVGTEILIEASSIKKQEPIQIPTGTSLSIKNLFYNIPARRNFLKSDPVELKHVIEEFQRVALAHPEIHFLLHHNNEELFNLASGNLRKRITGILGKNYDTRILPIEESTDLVKITGYLVKPEFSKKTRGEQFFFLNHRFIKNPYLHHAVQTAYEGLLPKENFPSYFIFLEVDPKTVDVNIHPTKVEVKFEDERSIYAILHSSVKRSIGIHQVSPTLDFESEIHLDIPLPAADKVISQPHIKVNPNYNPFSKSASGADKPIQFPTRDLEKQFEQSAAEKDEQQELFEGEKESRSLLQISGRFIISPVRNGFWMIDIKRAHERILYEQFIISLANHQGNSQQQLFPEVIVLNPADHALLVELSEDLRHVGMDIADMGNFSISINGIPASATDISTQQLLEGMLESLKNHSSEIKKNRLDTLARCLASSVCTRKPGKMSQEEMNNLIDHLFACETPYFSPSGKAVIVTFTEEDILKRFS